MIDLFDGAGLFPRAAHYIGRPAPVPARVREPESGARAFAYTERHLQCVWFDPRLRPAVLVTNRGETVIVEDPGIWNLEAGPDFRGAALRLEPGCRRLSGDVEIHIQASDWNAHRHAADPRYDRVRFHVTYFPGIAGGAGLPPGTIEISLRDPLAASPLFDFDSIDVTAYPFAGRHTSPPCFEVLREFGAAGRESLLAAAGEERLRRKSVRLRAAVAEKGSDQAVYEELLCALGYKHNKAPFRFLAETLPVNELREEAKGDRIIAYAILSGVAGLLPEKVNPRWDNDTRVFVRGVWDEWWKRRERWTDRLMARASWRTAGLRPTNQPLRRLMAAAVWFTREETPAAEWSRLAESEPGECVPRAMRSLTAPSDRYWDRRLSLSGRPQREDVALVGAARAQAIINNVFIPYLATRDQSEPFRAGILDQLPVETDNGVIRLTAQALFGPDHPPSLYRDGLRRQGLIQIFHDFCLNDRSRCRECALPDLLLRTGTPA